jgi:hypothetical protein
MPKTGKSLLTYVIVFFGAMFIVPCHLYAQDVKVTAQLSETNPFKGERVALTVEISGDGFRTIELPKLPTLTGLQYMSTSPNTSQSFSMINGVTSRKYGYTYFLQTLETGDYTIPAIKVSIDGKEYSTAPLKVKVLDRSSAASRESTEAMSDIFLRIEVSDRSPYVNQQILANVVLFFKQTTDVLSYQPNPSWKAEGFWKEDLDDGKETRTESVVIDGVRYRKATLLQYALFPSKSGRLTISPFQVTFNIRVPASGNHPFAGWGGFGSSQRSVDLSSEPVIINVRDLPAGSTGASLGAVGQFEIRRKVTKTNVFVGEAVEISTDIIGIGNIALVSRPDYAFPEGFEVYDPQVQTDINRKGNRVNGSKLIKDVVIPRRAGTFTIPEMTVSWYNDRTNSWQTTTLASVTINAEKDPNATQITNTRVTGSKEIITGLARWRPLRTQAIYDNNLWFWLGILSPGMIFGLGFAYFSYSNRMSTDIAFSRSKKASKMAAKWFAEAEKQANNGDIKAAYGSIHKAMAGYIGDRLNLATAGLSDEQYREALLANKTDELVANEIHALLTTCSTIRYAPLTDQATFEADIKRAKSLLQNVRWSI